MTSESKSSAGTPIDCNSMNKLSIFMAEKSAWIAFICVLGSWELGCRIFSVQSFVLPSPTAIVEAAGELGVGRWAEHASATLEVALLGYVGSIALAIPLAVGITRSVALSRTIMPWLVVVQSTPIVAVAPIIVVSLGAGTLPRVLITMLISFFPLVVATATGLASVPSEFTELSRSLRASTGREYTQIRLPYAIPYIFSGLKIGITLAIIGAVVAEFVAADKGLGYLILFATSSFKVPLAFAALVLLVLSSLALYASVVSLHKRFFPWSLAVRT